VDILPIINVSYTLGDLNPGQETEIKIRLTRASKMPKSGVYAPKFPKRKDETWWLILGNAHTRELLALRKTSSQISITTQLIFDVPETKGDYHYYLYLMCDSYIGLDQQYDIKFKVTKDKEIDEEEFNDDEEYVEFNDEDNQEFDETN